MTDTQQLFENVDHVIAMEIAKDMSRADMAVVRSYFLKHADEIPNLKGFVENLVLADAMPNDTVGDPGPGAPASKPTCNLSIKIEDGNNLYLIRLTNAHDGGVVDGRAKWGGGSPPLGFIPEGIYKGDKPLKNVGIFHVQNKQVRFVPEAAFPAKLDDVPDSTWLAFNCNIADMRKLWAELNYKPEQPLLIPFRYNLFDRVSKSPIWNVDHNDHSADDVHMDDAGAHDGVNALHGDSANKAVTTHGGMHPTGLQSLLAAGGMAVVRGRVHGGMHPTNLVEYFYADPVKKKPGLGLI